ncbi:MAG: GspE/PulE family protein [Candidatus Paceibacterota bacterium]|jgi:type IV pilus assembly protein PilB
MSLADDNKLKEIRRQEAEELAKIMSEKYKIPYVDLSVVSINTDALRLIPEKDAREADVAAFQLTGTKVHLLTISPEKAETRSAIESLVSRHYEPQLYLGTMTSLERAWDRYKEISYSMETRAGLIDVSGERLEESMSHINSLASLKKYVEEISASNSGHGVSMILELVLAGAIKMKASDIHMEPQEESVRLRYRLDGVLQDIAYFGHPTYKLIASRIKLISSLKLNIQKSAQDGRFTIGLKGKEMEVRTSVIPGAYGESIVMRLLDPESINIELEQMGIDPYLLGIFNKEISKPNGMILITGPTGSGKTTTLYAFLRKISSPENKTITIEDPIEYHLKGVSQTQVNEEKGYTFLEGLRSALRQDPDIIMVGEIRDKETADIAIQSALTGHLVFSTLHTNNAAGAIPRLIDLGVNPKIIGSALNLTIAQRLSRRLCQYCKKEVEPKPEEKKIIDEVVVSVQKKRKDIDLTGKSMVWISVGCEKCQGLGYKGRVGIFEAIVVGEEIGKLVDQSSNEADIKKAAEYQGILDMKEDGIVKVLNGITSIDELGRVVDLS